MDTTMHQAPKNEKFIRPKNSDVRPREHLTPEEVYRLSDAAKELGRHGHRDQLLIRMMYRHGLRLSELTDLRWDAIDLGAALIHVRRVKGSDDSMQPIEGEELRALRKLQRDYPDSAFVFCSERKTPLSPRSVQLLIARAGERAGFSFPIHPHMLRHSTGYALVNKGTDTRAIQGFLGHRNIQHTVLYTKLDANRFKGFDKLL